tara:strand:+ start:3380 stop:3652 length:273 start_codon:yes stop_codon:yes gene_type:complete
MNMNERIKQLALAAFQPINDIASEGVADFHTFNQPWFQLYNKQFAELIVKECLEQIDKIRDGHKADNEDEQALGASWAGLAVARHFGVED